MKQQQTLEEIFAGAVDLWRKEGIDSHDSASAFYNLQNDPVVQLFMTAVAHQSRLISSDIDSFRNDLLKLYWDSLSPEILSGPVPSVVWAQVGKKTQVGVSNKEGSVMDETVCFKLQSAESQQKYYPFIPLLSTRVVDAEIVGVNAVSSRVLRVDIALNESISSLAGLSFFSPAITPNAIESVILGENRIPIHRLSDLGALPFTKPFATSFDSMSDSMHHRMLLNVYDSLCYSMGEFFVFADCRQAENIQTVDGCISIDLEMNEAGISLSKNDIFLNTVPLVNVHLCQVSLSKEQPLCKIDTGTLKFLSLAPASDSSRVALRQVGTERQTLESWNLRLQRILDQYDENYALYNSQMEPHLAATIRQLVTTLRELSKQPASPAPPLYVVLLDKMVSSLTVPYLLTDGASANNIKPKGKGQMEISSPEYDPAKSQLLTPSFGGSDGAPTLNSHYRNYIMQTGDRIVTKSDIEVFCKYKLYRDFNIASGSVKMAIRPIVNNTADGFYERVMLVEIQSLVPIDNPSRVALALQLMLMPRTATLTPIRVIIN